MATRAATFPFIVKCIKLSQAVLRVVFTSGVITCRSHLG